MITTITYNISDDKIDEILGMLGYIEGSKEDFMNKTISSVVIPAISDVFTNIKQKEASEHMARIPSDVRANVESMVSITTL